MIADGAMRRPPPINRELHTAKAYSFRPRRSAPGSAVIVALTGS